MLDVTCMYKRDRSDFSLFIKISSDMVTYVSVTSCQPCRQIACPRVWQHHQLSTKCTALWCDMLSVVSADSTALWCDVSSFVSTVHCPLAWHVVNQLHMYHCRLAVSKMVPSVSFSVSCWCTILLLLPRYHQVGYCTGLNLASAISADSQVYQHHGLLFNCSVMLQNKDIRTLWQWYACVPFPCLRPSSTSKLPW